MNGVDAHPIEHRARLDAVAHLHNVACAVKPTSDHLDTISRGRCAVEGRERFSPRAEHLFSIAESLGGIAPEGAGKEHRKSITKRRIEPVDGNCRLVLGESRVGEAVPEAGRRASQHFMESHSHRVPLGVKVPARWPAIRQKRVEIWPRPSSDRLDWRARKREVKENQAIRAGPGDLGDANVVRLYVAMGDPFLLEVLDGGQQIFAKSAHQIERERVTTADPLSERLVASPVHEDGRTTRDRDLRIEANDILMVETANNVRFGTDPVHVCVVKRDLQHQFLVGSFTFYKKNIGAAAATEPALDDEAVVEPVVRTRSRWIDVGGRSRLGGSASFSASAR